MKGFFSRWKMYFNQFFKWGVAFFTVTELYSFMFGIKAGAMAQMISMSNVFVASSVVFLVILGMAFTSTAIASTLLSLMIRGEENENQ